MNDVVLDRSDAELALQPILGTGVGGGLAIAKLTAIALGVALHLRQVHIIVALLTAFYIAVAIVPWTFLFLSL